MNPLVDVKTLTILVQPHGGSETGGITSSSSILGTSNIEINGKIAVRDGDEGTWICPICGVSGKCWANGNSQIFVGHSGDLKELCVTGTSFSADHNGMVVGEDIIYDTKVHIETKGDLQI